MPRLGICFAYYFPELYVCSAHDSTSAVVTVSQYATTATAAAAVVTFSERDRCPYILIVWLGLSLTNCCACLRTWCRSSTVSLTSLTSHDIVAWPCRRYDLWPCLHFRFINNGERHFIDKKVRLPRRKVRPGFESFFKIIFLSNNKKRRKNKNCTWFIKEKSLKR